MKNLNQKKGKMLDLEADRKRIIKMEVPELLDRIFKDLATKVEAQLALYPQLDLENSEHHWNGWTVFKNIHTVLTILQKKTQDCMPSLL